MSATFWNMRRRRAANKARIVEKPVEKVDNSDKVSAEKPKKAKVKTDA